MLLDHQAAIEAEEEEKRVLKLKNREEMEKMLAANQDLHQRRAERISEEQAVSWKLPVTSNRSENTKVTGNPKGGLTYI